MARSLLRPRQQLEAEAQRADPGAQQACHVDPIVGRAPDVRDLGAAVPHDRGLEGIDLLDGRVELARRHTGVDGGELGGKLGRHWWGDGARVVGEELIERAQLVGHRLGRRGGVDDDEELGEPAFGAEHPIGRVGLDVG